MADDYLKEEYYERQVALPKIFKQAELNDLVCDLERLTVFWSQL